MKDLRFEFRMFGSKFKGFEECWGFGGFDIRILEFRDHGPHRAVSPGPMYVFEFRHFGFKFEGFKGFEGFGGFAEFETCEGF